MARTPRSAIIFACVVASVMLLVVVPLSASGHALGANPPAVRFLGSPASVLRVPSQYAKIQGAVNAAHPGDTILIAPGTYVQQFVVDKSLTITGSGVGKTIIQSPANLKPDAFGNPWTIEIGNAATVTLSGFTLVTTLQCINGPDAGGGIGVGGSAVMNLESAAVITTGASEGGACATAIPGGFMSYGTGVDFGLDFVTGSPPASQLIGSGTISGASISGFGFGGPDVAIGGLINSAAGSSALLWHDQIATSADDIAGFPGVAVGWGSNSSSATIFDSVLSGQLSLYLNVIDLESTGTSATIEGNTISGMPLGGGIWVGSGATGSISQNLILGGPFGTGPLGAANGFAIGVESSSAYIADNSIVVGEFGEGILVLLGSTATITANVITGVVGTTSDFGIEMFFSSATITLNSIGVFECEYNPPPAPSECGPESDQISDIGVWDIADAGLGTTIENNVVYETDIGILLTGSFPNGVGGVVVVSPACGGCIVKDNLLLNNVDYGLAGEDGDFSFVQNQVVGGLYGVGAIAANIDTVVTLSHVSISGESIAPFYIEGDNGNVATVVGT